MNRDQLFIRTFEDLEARLESKDMYEILMIAGLLRKLLLDGIPLVDQVNRERRQKIRFIVNDRPVPTREPIPIIWSVEDGFDPNTSVPHLCRPIEVNKDKLLSCPVLMYERHIFTVKELVLHVAHIQGAIHPGMPKSEKDKALKQLTEILGIGGLPAGLRLLLAIGRVVKKGLEPLKEQIMRRD